MVKQQTVIAFARAYHEGLFIFLYSPSFFSIEKCGTVEA